MKLILQINFFKRNFYLLNYLFIFIILFINGLQFPTVKADEEADETLKKRLSEIPKRIQLLTNIAYPDGFPENILKYYTLPYVNESTTCGRQTYIYREALKEFETWAVQMVDSSGKIPSGMLQGHFHDTGSYDECLETAELSPFPVQHCVIQYGNFVRLPKRSKIDWEKTDTIIGGIPILKPRLHIGYCLPASCSRDDIKFNFERIFDKYNLTVHLNKYSCTASNEENPYGTLEYAVAIALLTPILIVLISTYYDLKNSGKEEKTLRQKIMNCCSLYENGRNLFTTSSPKRPLSVLNGIRFLSILWIITAHHWLFRVMKPTLNYREMLQLFSKYYGFTILNGLLAVDNFILLNGILLSYIFMSFMETGMKFNLLIFYSHRLIRILPGYLVQILLAMTYFPRYFSSGPLWKEQILRSKENCYDNWWTNILFINNYVNIDRQCIPSTWYLSIDMQLHFISPIFLFALYKYKWFIKFGIPTCIGLAVLSSFLNSFIGRYPAGSIIASDFTTIYKYPYEHITTHTKLGCWFIGLGLGYILHQNEKKKIVFSRMAVKLGWTFTITLGTFVLIAIEYFHQENIGYNRVIHSLYSGFASTIWGFCIAWMILACETGNGSPVHTFLSWRVFQPLGKLSFVLYMLHVAVQYGTGGALKISQYMEIFPNAVVIFGELACCIFFAPFLSFFYEAPFIRLEKVFVGGILSKKMKVADVENSKTKELPDDSVTKLNHLNSDIKIITNGKLNDDITAITTLHRRNSNKDIP